jgi:hypothetical protein
MESDYEKVEKIIEKEKERERIRILESRVRQLMEEKREKSKLPRKTTPRETSKKNLNLFRTHTQ